jgi:hypothetical protein
MSTPEHEETDVRLDTVQDLLAAIERLPEPERLTARARVEAAIDRPAAQARAALGLLALDVAGSFTDARTGQLIVLPDLEQRVAVSA